MKSLTRWLLRDGLRQVLFSTSDASYDNIIDTTPHHRRTQTPIVTLPPIPHYTSPTFRGPSRLIASKQSCIRSPAKVGGLDGSRRTLKLQDGDQQKQM